MKIFSVMTMLLAWATVASALTNCVIRVDQTHNVTNVNAITSYTASPCERILLDTVDFRFCQRITQLIVRVIPSAGESATFTVAASSTNSVGQYLIDSATMCAPGKTPPAHFISGDRIDILFLHKADRNPNEDFMNGGRLIPAEWCGRVRIE